MLPVMSPVAVIANLRVSDTLQVISDVLACLQVSWPETNASKSLTWAVSPKIVVTAGDPCLHVEVLSVVKQGS